MIPLIGFGQLGVFAVYAIYLPELFPTSLRSTGTRFCYNFGRVAAATAPFTIGQITRSLGGNPRRLPHGGIMGQRSAATRDFGAAIPARDEGQTAAGGVREGLAVACKEYRRLSGNFTFSDDFFGSFISTVSIAKKINEKSDYVTFE